MTVSCWLTSTKALKTSGAEQPVSQQAYKSMYLQRFNLSLMNDRTIQKEFFSAKDNRNAGFGPKVSQIPSGKLTWQRDIPIFNRKYIFKWWIFHCYVSLPKGK